MKHIPSVASAILISMFAIASAAADSTQIPPPAATTIPAPTATQPLPLKNPLEALNNAIRDYQAGKYSEALNEIDDARKGVSAKRLIAYQALMPPAPGGGWTYVDKPDGLLMSGVDREYTANGQTVSLNFMIDKSLVNMTASASKILDAFASSPNTDNKPLFVKGNKAVYQEIKFGDKILMYKLTVYAGDVLVTVQSATIGKDTLMKFAELVDYERLKILN